MDIPQGRWSFLLYYATDTGIYSNALEFTVGSRSIICSQEIGQDKPAAPLTSKCLLNTIGNLSIQYNVGQLRSNYLPV